MAVAVCHSRTVQQLSSATRPTESCPGMIGSISPDVKQMGARSAGNPHAACDVEGAGNVARSGCLGQLARQSSTLPGKAVFRPVACNQVPGARGRGQGTETLAELWRLGALARLGVCSGLTPEHAEGRWTGGGPFFEPPASDGAGYKSA